VGLADWIGSVVLYNGRRRIRRACQSEGKASSPLPELAPSLPSTRQIYFSADAGHWCASMAKLAARHYSHSKARTSRFLPLTLFIILE